MLYDRCVVQDSPWGFASSKFLQNKKLQKSLWLYDSMSLWLDLYISSICSLLSDHGISVWACSFPSLLRLGKYVFPCKKDLNTHTHKFTEKKSFDPQRWNPFFLDVLILSIVFFMLALFEVCEDDVVSCLKGRPVCWRFLSTTKFGLVKFKPGRNLGTWGTPSKNCLSISLLKWELFEFYIPSFATFLRVVFSPLLLDTYLL